MRGPERGNMGSLHWLDVTFQVVTVLLLLGGLAGLAWWWKARGEE